MATAQEVLDACRANPDRTTVGCVGFFGCPGCNRYLPASENVGGVWTGWGRGEGCTGEHVMVCKDCSEAKS